MKKKTIVFSCLAVLFFLSAIGGFSSGSAFGGVCCLLVCYFFAFFAFRSVKPTTKINKKIAGVGCGVVFLFSIAFSSCSINTENIPSTDKSDFSVSTENVSDAENLSANLPEISEQNEDASNELLESPEKIENASNDLPETSAQGEDNSSTLSETPKQSEDASNELLESPEKIENASNDLPETSERGEDNSSTLPDTPKQNNDSSSLATDAQNNMQSAGSENNFNVHDNPDQQNTTASYVLNTSSHKFHYPNCSSVAKIAEKNYAVSNSNRDELISQGYSPCGNCKP